MFDGCDEWTVNGLVAEMRMSESHLPWGGHAVVIDAQVSETKS
jgi:hypothetical protein